jgi:hypothetical protein
MNLQEFRVMELVLDERLAFKAMVTFIATLHEELGWDDLPSLLGSMALIDGVPLDVAIAEDWKGSVEQVLADSCSPAVSAGLTPEQAYAAVVHFLDARFRKGQIDIGRILMELRSIDLLGSSVVADEWRKSTVPTSDPTKSIAAVIVKDGVSYELHTKPEKAS